jgi:hypothetical protein
MLHCLQYSFVQANIFWRTPARYNQCIIIFSLYLFEGGIQREVMAWLFSIGLISDKIVGRGPDPLASFRARANRVDGMPHHLQCLEGHHHFIIFHKVTHEH